MKKALGESLTPPAVAAWKKLLVILVDKIADGINSEED